MLLKNDLFLEFSLEYPSVWIELGGKTLRLSAACAAYPAFLLPDQIDQPEMSIRQLGSH